jgi:GT2 family glycosyltransferase
MTLAILVATKGDRQPQGLEHAPAHTYLEDTRPGWAKASNVLLDRAAAAGADALFLDDDVTLLPETFEDMAQWRTADTVVGFQIRGGDVVISAGHYLSRGGILLPNRDAHTPAYMAHVTASAMYIPHAVLAAGVRFPDWPGVHSEDAAYTYDVWLHGFKVLYWPSVVLHEVAENGIGLTKVDEPNLGARLLENARQLGMWMQEHKVMERVPTGVQKYEYAR